MEKGSKEEEKNQNKIIQEIMKRKKSEKDEKY